MKHRMQSLNVFKKVIKKKKKRKKGVKKKKIKSKTRRTKPMTEEEFLAFLRGLSYYHLNYMNYKMIVGINDKVIDDDMRTVMVNVKKAIRYQVYNLCEISAKAIVNATKYNRKQIKIVEIKVVLPSIDETQPMPL